MSFANVSTLSSRLGLHHGRVALALAHATVDSQTQQRVIAYGSTVHEQFIKHDYVQDLAASTDEWEKLINHPFPRKLAEGTAPLNGFRHYMIQDATYLEYYYRVSMEAVSKSGTFQDITDFATKLSSHAHYVSDAFETCTNKLGVPKDDVAKEPKSQQLRNSIQLYEDVVRNKGSDLSWLDIHIVLLPCILGYDTIASSLLKKRETVRNTLYYNLWIQANAGGNSPKDYKTFINNNIGNLSEDERKKKWPGWVDIFRKACGTEQAFFGLASPNAFQPYNVVPASDRPYRIRSYHSGNPYLVSTTPSSVTIQSAPPQDDGKWKLTNTPDGYIIQNVSQQAFLDVSIRDPTRPFYGVSVSQEEQKWSINPVEVYDEKGPYQAYQLFVPERLQYVLDAGDAGSNASDSKAFVTNNSEKSSQLWLLEPVN